MDILCFTELKRSDPGANLPPSAGVKKIIIFSTSGPVWSAVGRKFTSLLWARGNKCVWKFIIIQNSRLEESRDMDN